MLLDPNLSEMTLMIALKLFATHSEYEEVASEAEKLRLLILTMVRSLIRHSQRELEKVDGEF
jgi:hypothetical protein